MSIRSSIAPTNVTWTGRSQEEYPWGKESDFEGLAYETTDDHPGSSSVPAEAEIVMTLKDFVLTCQGHLTLTSDAKNFYYRYIPDLLQGGKPLKPKGSPLTDRNTEIMMTERRRPRPVRILSDWGGSWPIFELEKQTLAR